MVLRLQPGRTRLVQFQDAQYLLPPRHLNPSILRLARHNSPMSRLRSMVISSLVVASLALINIVPAQAFILPPQFFKFAASKTLDNPGILLIDPTTDQTLFSVGADVGRAPASVLKLFSMST